MKHFTKFSCAAAALLFLLAGCEREATITPPRTDDVTDGRICFKADGLDMQVDTRTSEVTTANLSSFTVATYAYAVDAEWIEDEEYEDGGYWEETGATDYSWTTTATKSGNLFVTNKYWGTRDTDAGSQKIIYSFICTNLPEDTDGGQAGDGYYNDAGSVYCNIPNCDTDWIWATPSYSWGQTVNVTFTHLLSRIGTVTVNGPSGYTLTVNSMKAKAAVRKPELAGDTDDATPAEKSLSVGSNNVWFCPGQWGYFNYELEGAGTDPSTGALESYSGHFVHDPVFTINYTLTKGDFSKTYEKSQTFTLTQGKTHNLTINITTDEAQAIQLNSTVTAWSAQATSITIN